MKPIRPTPLTVAAVLLLVLGAQCILSFLITVLGVFAHQVGIGSVFQAPPYCFIPFLAVVSIVPGINFLKVGLGILSGKSFLLGLSASRFVVFGMIAIIIFSLGLVIVLLATLDQHVDFRTFLLSIVVLLDSVALYVAGLLIQRDEQKYKDWLQALQDYESESDYETDGN